MTITEVSLPRRAKRISGNNTFIKMGILGEK